MSGRCRCNGHGHQPASLPPHLCILCLCNPTIELPPPKVEDGPGMLRARLKEDQQTAGTVLVAAAHAERAAFARQALAVKLRELDTACAERDRMLDETRRLTKECRDLAIECERFDADLVAAISGRLRRFP